MNVRVLKFGGSSFRTLNDFPLVAEMLRKELHRSKSRLVVVVSAMHGDTDRLLRAGLSLNPSLSARARDALITMGELISAPLLRIALEALGVRATSLAGYQVGILSDSRFSQAGIRSIDSRPLRRALHEHQVVVVAGAQAVDRKGRITML